MAAPRASARGSTTPTPASAATKKRAAGRSSPTKVAAAPPPSPSTRSNTIEMSVSSSPPATSTRSSSTRSNSSNSNSGIGIDGRSKSASPAASAQASTMLPVPRRAARGSGGNVYVFGNGDAGQLGLGEDIKDALRPKQIKLLEDIVDIVAGGMHTLALKSDGTLYSWGNNDEGALGRHVPEGKDCDVDVVADSAAYDFVKLAAGDSISLAISARGELYAWGTFRGDQSSTLGFSPSVRRQLTPARVLPDHVIVDVAAGDNHALALTSAGLVYAWGNSEQRQGGFRTTRWPEAGLTPRALVFGSLRGRRRRRRSMGGNDGTQQPEAEAASAASASGWVGGRVRIAGIACGSFHSLAIDTEGDVWAFGLNNYGQCGEDPDVIDMITEPRRVRLSPESQSQSQSGSGQRAVVAAAAVAAAAGEHHSVLLASDGSVISFGKSDGGELGLGYLTLAGAAGAAEASSGSSVKTCIWQPQQVTQLGGRDIVRVVAGTHHNVAVARDGAAYYWGTNYQGQLGDGTTDDAMTPRKYDFSKSGAAVLGAACGAQHTVLIAKRP